MLASIRVAFIAQRPRLLKTPAGPPVAVFDMGGGTRDRNSGSKLAMVETTWKHGKGARRDFRRSRRRLSALMSTVGDCESGDRHCEVVQS